MVVLKCVSHTDSLCWHYVVLQRTCDMNHQNNKEIVAKTLELLLKFLWSLEDNVFTITCKRKKDRKLFRVFTVYWISLRTMEDKTEYLNQKLAKRESVLREFNVKSKSTTKTIQVNLSSFMFSHVYSRGKNADKVNFNGHGAQSPLIHRWTICKDSTAKKQTKRESEMKYV